MLSLVSFDLCPYVQRAAIALNEKGVLFERRNIDLADRPAWFKAISPLGKVPLLCIGDAVLFESAAIVEYLEDTQARPMHPADPLVRARHRAWMEFGSSILADIWIIETTADPVAFEAKRRLLRDKFGRVEDELIGTPYFAGAEFTLVDTVFAPIFRYFDVFDTLIDLSIFAETPNVGAWRTELAKRESVRNAVGADYPQLLHAFLVRHDAHMLKPAA